MNDAKYIVQSDHREMKVNVRIFRDIDELKIWGNGCLLYTSDAADE